MATIPEMATFMAGLPEDALAVLVVQRGKRPFVLRTEKLELGFEWPNWPRAVWEGLSIARGVMPDPDAAGGGSGGIVGGGKKHEVDA